MDPVRRVSVARTRDYRGIEKCGMQQLRSKGIGPIGEQREWSVQRALFHSRGREPLAIGGNIIDDVECTNPHRFLRYGLGSSDREVVLAGCYLDSHQNAIQS